MQAQASTARFALLFAIANAGAFIGCLPLLTILLPLKAAAIDAAEKTALLSWTVFWGALTASAVNIVAGALSDRTKSTLGRRKPWIICGALAAAASYAVIARAESAAALLIGVVLFQAAFNLFMPALAALLPDRIPDRRKGAMAAFLALGPPIGLGLGGVIAGAALLSLDNRFAIVAAVFLAAVAPLVLFWREPRDSIQEPVLPADAPQHARTWRDFALVWISRVLIQIAISTSQGYALYFLHHAASKSESFPALPPETLLGRLLLLSTAISIATAFAVGIASDAVRRRKYFVAASGAAIFTGLAIFALFPTWPGVIVCQVFYGLGVGLYSAADVALAAEILPQKRHAGRDLAVLNLGNTLPQMLAPMLALMLAASPTGYSTLFLISAAAAGCGGLFALRVRYSG